MNKASGGGGTPAELFQFVKHDAGIMRAALSKNHLSGFEIAQLIFHHLH